ncbi:MAG: tetratricopeptide repeat protein [Desulfuromonadaceae bacterium]|jgi:tetratricopeptide (TPR) repeat protein
MNLKPFFILGIILLLLLWLSRCEYGAEHQDVAPKYKNAHLTAVSAQNLLKEKKYEEALKYYEMAQREMEHPSIRADLGEDIYINYGFVMNDIGVIHLGWALYGKELNTQIDHVELATIDQEELAKARQALETAVTFYERWFKHNPKNYERFSQAIAESLANYGIALKYSGELEPAREAFQRSLRYNPDNGNAERSLKMLGIDPQPYIEAGKAERDRHKKFTL